MELSCFPPCEDGNRLVMKLDIFSIVGVQLGNWRRSIDGVKDSRKSDTNAPEKK